MRIEAERLLNPSDRFLRPPDEVQNISEVPIVIGIVGIERDRSLCLSTSLLRLLPPQKKLAQNLMSIRVGVIQGDSLLLLLKYPLQVLGSRVPVKGPIIHIGYSQPSVGPRILRV